MKIVPFIDKGGEYRWHLVAANGKNMADSAEGYESSVGLFRAVDNFLSELYSGRIEFEEYRDSAGEHRWRVKELNGKIIADSGEGYKTKASVKRAIATLSEQTEQQSIVVVTDAL
jgi:uncharacterized protein YegP (UPF0339 family)